jgi:hypothetical protein
MKTYKRNLRIIIAQDEDTGIIWGNGRVIGCRDEIFLAIAGFNLERYERRRAQ